MKLQTRNALVSVAFVGCALFGWSTVSSNRAHEERLRVEKQDKLQAAQNSLRDLRSDRDRAAAEVASLEVQAQRADEAMKAVTDEETEITRIVNSWSDDIRANIRDITPDSIVTMVRQGDEFVQALRNLRLSDTQPSYRAAFDGYVKACSDLRDAERIRLTIIYNHLGMLNSNANNDQLTDDQRQTIASIEAGDWIGQGTRVNAIIDTALADINRTMKVLDDGQPTAASEVATQIQTLRTRVTSFDPDIEAAAANVRELGGTP